MRRALQGGAGIPLGLALYLSAHLQAAEFKHLHITGLEAPNQPALQESVAPLLGKPIDEALTTRLADAVLAHFTRYDFPVVTVEEVKPQDASSVAFHATAGRVQHALMAGGAHSTQRAIARRWAGMEGQTLQLSLINDELDWLHRNPLHIASVSLQEVAADAVDVRLDLEQSRTLRLTTGYRNDGIPPLSEHRLSAGLEVADVLGLPSWWQLRSSVAEDVDSYQLHSAAARFFLPWRHEVVFTGAYVQARAPADVFEGLIDSLNATSWQAAMRYTIPQRIGSWTLDVSAGMEFRRTNNTLDFGTLSLAGEADTAVLTMDALLRRQRWNSDLGFSLGVAYAPGGWTAASDDESHNALRPGAEARFLTARASAWHEHVWKSRWSVRTQVSGQWTSAPVLPSDQISLGGSYSVRGFEEMHALSDAGLWGSLEGRTPGWDVKKVITLQAFAFAEGGVGRDDARAESFTLASSGLGLRFWRRQAINASCAYAWRLTEPGGRFHLSFQIQF